jgi:hypothetical protein
MPRARRSTRKSVRKSRSPRRVRSSTKVRRARKATPKRTRRVGSKKMVNKWVQHIKAQSKKMGLTYKQAMMDPRVKASYKKM